MKIDRLNEEYSEYEDSFLKNRNETKKAVLSNMIETKVHDMVCNYTAKHDLSIKTDELESIVQFGTNWFLSQYERKDFRVKKFTSYVVFAFLKGMSQRRQQQEMFDFGSEK